MPDVSVIIPTCNDRVLLAEQLRALAAQQDAPTFEVLVADNGSADRLAEFCATHPLREQLGLRYLDATGPRRAAHARNVGASHATAELLLFCDDDDRVHPNWVARMTDFLEQGFDVVSSGIEGATLNSATPRRYIPVQPPERLQPPGLVAPIVIGASMGVRAAVFRKLGGLDVSYRANEDVAFGWAAHNQDFRVGFLPEALVAYRFKTGLRAGLRQGWSRGVTMIRLTRDFPNIGLPNPGLGAPLAQLARLAVTWRMPGEEWGIMAGVALGMLAGTLRW